MNLVQRQIFGLKKSTFSYLLDDYPTAKIAYSFRKLRSAYSGNCIEVRRSSDNTTQNIGFVDNLLDETSLLSFVGSGDGFIKTWYDQSGNSTNLVSSTNATQSRIVLAGVVHKENDKPAIYSSTAMNSYSNTFGTTYDSAFTVARITSTTLVVIPFGTVTADNYYGVCQSGSGSLHYQGFGTPTVYKNGNVLGTTRGDFYTAFVTGNLRFLLSEFSNYSTTLGIRNIQYLAVPSENYIQEHITYGTDKTSDKTGIETNINTYYSIY